MSNSVYPKVQPSNYSDVVGITLTGYISKDEESISTEYKGQSEETTLIWNDPYEEKEGDEMSKGWEYTVVQKIFQNGSTVEYSVHDGRVIEYNLNYAIGYKKLVIKTPRITNSDGQIISTTYEFDVIGKKQDKNMKSTPTVSVEFKIERRHNNR